MLRRTTEYEFSTQRTVHEIFEEVGISEPENWKAVPKWGGTEFQKLEIKWQEGDVSHGIEVGAVTLARILARRSGELPDPSGSECACRYIPEETGRVVVACTKNLKTKTPK